MITPAYGLTATERVLPSFTLDWTTGLVQSTVDVTRAGVATLVGANGLIQSAAENTQRIDYSTGVSALLVEESRTNLALRSQELADAVWQSGTITPISSAETAPDGVNTFYKLVPADGLLFRQAAQQIALADNTVYCLSVFLKAAEWNSVRLALRNKANTVVIAVFNLDTESVDTNNTINAGYQKLDNGVYRFWIVVDSSSGVHNPLFRIYPINNSTNNTPGNGTSGIYIWGAQLEEGAFHTSYIPTELLPVTRDSEPANVLDISWYDQTKGTFVVEYSKITAADGHAFAMSDGTLSNRTGFRVGTNFSALMFDGGVQQTNITISGSTVVNQVYKVAFGFESNNAQAALSTVLGTQDTSVSLPTVSMLNVGHVAGAAYLFGHIRKLMYFPQRLTNAELQAVTK